jgi:hypothetical protein
LEKTEKGVEFVMAKKSAIKGANRVKQTVTSKSEAPKESKTAPEAVAAVEDEIPETAFVIVGVDAAETAEGTVAAHVEGAESAAAASLEADASDADGSEAVTEEQAPAPEAPPEIKANSEEALPEVALSDEKAGAPALPLSDVFDSIHEHEHGRFVVAYLPDRDILDARVCGLPARQRKDKAAVAAWLRGIYPEARVHWKFTQERPSEDGVRHA